MFREKAKLSLKLECLFNPFTPDEDMGLYVDQWASILCVSKKLASY